MAHHALAPPPYGERRARDEPALLVGEPGDDPGSVLRLAIARNCHEASLRVGGWAVGPVHLGIRRSWMHHVYAYAACPRSRAKPLVRPTSAALLRLHRPSSGPGTRSARLLPIEMMRPPSPDGAQRLAPRRTRPASISSCSVPTVRGCDGCPATSPRPAPRVSRRVLWMASAISRNNCPCRRARLWTTAGNSRGGE